MYEGTKILNLNSRRCETLDTRLLPNLQITLLTIARSGCTHGAKIGRHLPSPATPRGLHVRAPASESISHPRRVKARRSARVFPEHAPIHRFAPLGLRQPRPSSRQGRARAGHEFPSGARLRDPPRNNGRAVPAAFSRLSHEIN